MTRRYFTIVTALALVGLTIASLTFNSSAAPPSPTPTEVVGYLQVEGVEGEETDDAFRGAIPVLSFDFLATNSPGTGGGGGGASKANFKTLTVATLIDKASPLLLKRLVQGTHIKKVTISLVRFGEIDYVYKRWVLNDVLITNYREYLTGKPNDTPILELSFNYGKVDVRYNVQDEAGGTSRTTRFCFNLETNNVCPVSP